MLDKKYTAFSGRLVIIGFGSIGQGVLPLLLRHIEMRPGQITVITAEPRGHEEAVEYGIEFIEAGLTHENYRAVLELCAARKRAGLAPETAGPERRPDRDHHAWRQSWARVALRQAGAHRCRARRQSGGRRAGGSRGLGSARAASRGQGDPHR